MDIDEFDSIDEEEENEEDVKKKVRATNYGKVAAAIGNFQNRGISVDPPDINQSSYTFTPIADENVILYGLRGITRIGSDVVKAIIAKRPYSSLNDFINKVKVNKPQVINLIKCGAFDRIEGISRENIMANYIDSITDKKTELNLRNMQALISKDLIPDEMVYYGKLFSFNKFLKSQKQDSYYMLNNAAINFISEHFDVDMIDNGAQISQKIWDKAYSKAMEPMRQYIKDHKTELLMKLNGNSFEEISNKYGSGTISRWEMESVNYYSHPHELIQAADKYDDFFKLSPQPEIDYTFETKTGQTINMYKLHYIIGTVIDKDKLKNTVTLLTPTGVVIVKIYKNQYAGYDKQISIKDNEGHKHVIEPSWFKRGTLLMVQGIRRDSNFIPKKRKDSYYPIISKIIKIHENGRLEFQTERMEVDA